MTIGSDPGTGTSRAHSSGTRSKPSLRAATAGNSASRSFVSVKMQLTTSAGPNPLRCMISRISASVASRIASASLRSTVVAPRRANRRIGAGSCHAWPGSHPARPPSPPPSSGGTIPERFSCNGAGDRPALRFGGVPSQARELALLVIDPDAGGFVHWTVYGMAPDTKGIAATGLPAGAKEGSNTTGDRGWTPPCPPSGTHRYQFDLYWLRSPSRLPARAGPQTGVDAGRRRARGRRRAARGRGARGAAAASSSAATGGPASRAAQALALGRGQPPVPAGGE